MGVVMVPTVKKKSGPAMLTIRCDSEFRTMLGRRAALLGKSVQQMTHQLLDDLLAGKLAFRNPRGEWFRYSPDGAPPVKLPILVSPGTGAEVPPVSGP